MQGGQIKVAVKNRIPCIVVIRDPVQSVASTLVRQTEWTMEKAVQRYIAFHECVLMHLERLCIIEFEMLISREKEVLRKVKRLCQLDHLDLSKTLQRNELFRLIESYNAKLDSGRKEAVAVPNPSKEKKKEQLRNSIENATGIGRCKELYTKIRSQLHNYQDIVR